jgi:phage shock protein C
MQKRLLRSRTERMVAGVCGGLGEYLDMDPTVVRVLWVLISLLAGVGVLLYLIMWVIVPLELPAPPGGTPVQS